MIDHRIDRPTSLYRPLDRLEGRLVNYTPTCFYWVLLDVSTGLSSPVNICIDAMNSLLE